jgi:tetratricopeptide (TPR) repeat protein
MAYSHSQATELDPKYSKGWSRLGSALTKLRLYEESAKAWNKAIESLPLENLNPTETQQLKTYKEGLWAAESGLKEKTDPSHTIIKAKEGKMPWEKAAKMLGELKAARNYRSSVRHEFINFEH